MKHAHSNCKQPTQGRRKAAIFFIQKYFCSKCCETSFSLPYNCKRKQAARTQAAKQAFTTLRAGRKAARQSVAQIRLTVSGLVTANVQAYVNMQAGKNRPCKAFRAIA